MKTYKDRLPPKWIRAFSWIFLIFLAAPIFVVQQISGSGTPLTVYGVSAFGVTLMGNKDPLSWMLALDLVMFLAALTGLFILTRRRFAYDFGIAYCVITFAITVPAHLIIGTLDDKAWINIWIQYPMLLAFLIHLIRNRLQWINQKGEQDGGGNALEPPSHPSTAPTKARATP